MVIANRDAVVAGTKLTASYKKLSYVCMVEAGTDGKLAFTYDGKTYNSPSSAGAAVMGTACNGWRFWGIDGEAAAPDLGSTTRAKTSTKTSTRTTGTAKPRKTRSQKTRPAVLHKHDNQTDLSEGETRWVCDACLKHFIVFGNEKPAACPEGHRDDDPELSLMATTDESEGPSAD